MHAPPPSELPAEEALCLYQRLLERDPLAPSDFAVAFLAPLISWLRATNPAVDPTLCEEAAGEAIVHFINHPASYDPERLGVGAFLRMAAQRDLQNALRKERRHHRKRRDWNAVEQGPEDGKYVGMDDDPSLPLQIEEARRRSGPAEAVWRQLTDKERRVWEEMEQGECSTSVFAGILGVAHLPADLQRREVKRVKDRLKKRMERAGGKGGRSD